MKGNGAVAKAPIEPAQEALGSVRKKTRPAKSARFIAKQHVPERSRPQSEDRPILDERVPSLIFDSLATVQAAIVGATKDIPYKALRQAMAIGEQEKRELTSAAQAVAATHAAFFSQYKDGLEIVASLMAINAAKIDHLLTLIDQSEGSPVPAESIPPGNHICSARAALGIALIVLAPLGLLTAVLIVEHLRRESYAK